MVRDSMIPGQLHSRTASALAAVERAMAELRRGGIVVIRDCCYSARGNNNEFFMDRVFPRMGRVMMTDDAVKLIASAERDENSTARRGRRRRRRLVLGRECALDFRL